MTPEQKRQFESLKESLSKSVEDLELIYVLYDSSSYSLLIQALQKLANAVYSTRYKLVYDMEYADGSKGAGSHGNFLTLGEAQAARDVMLNREYEPYELEFAIMYYNIDIVEV